MIHAFLYGIILALGLIIPLGVQNIFLFNQGASQRHFIYAMPSVLTASVCDTLLILISVLGISVIVLTIPWLKTVIFLIGFCFLTYMGWLIWRNSSNKLRVNREPFSAKRQIGFAASVSLLNPHALLDTVGVIGTNSLHFIGKDRVVYTLACIFISWIWFFSLSVAGHFLHRLDQSGIMINMINKLSALIIWGVAVYIGIQLFH